MFRIPDIHALSGLRLYRDSLPFPESGLYAPSVHRAVSLLSSVGSGVAGIHPLTAADCCSDWSDLIAPLTRLSGPPVALSFLLLSDEPILLLYDVNYGFRIGSA